MSRFDLRKFNTGQAKRRLKPAEVVTPNCRSLRDNDEWVCPERGCGLRWGVGERRPLNCPLKGKPK